MKTSNLSIAKLILLIFVLTANCVFSQELGEEEISEIKVLKERLYKATVDSTKARISTDISTIYSLNIEIDSTKKYASIALELLEDTHTKIEKSSSKYKMMKAKAIENYGSMLAYQNAKKAIDTLRVSLQLWQDIGNKLGIANAYTSLAAAHSFSSNQTEAINYFSESLALQKELKNKTEEAEILYFISLEKRYLGKFGDALEYSLKSYKVAEEIQDTLLITDALLGNSFNYLLAKNYSEALQEQKKALRLFQLFKDSTGIARTYNDMGVTYMYADSLEDALKYHKMALDIRKKVDPRSVGISYNYVAEIYKKQGKLNEALSSINEGLAYSIKLDDSRFIMDSYQEAGNIYLELKAYDKAITNYNLGLEVAEKNNNRGYQSLFHMKLGQVQNITGDSDKALVSLKMAEKVVLSNDYSNREYIYEIMTETYLGIKDYKNAFGYQTKFYQMSDSLNSIKKDDKITKLTQELIYENKSALQKASQDKEIAIKESQIKIQKLIRNLSIIGLLLILVFAIVFFKRFKEKRKLSISLEKTLNELKGTQKQLIQSEKMASLGELTAGIAHEIQNPLNFVNNFSEVSKELLEEMRQELKNGDTEEVNAIMKDIIQNLEKINHHGKRADAIVKGMLQHSRASGDKKEPTIINALADEYLRLAYHGLRAKDKSFNADIKTDFDESIKNISVIPQDIGRVVLNLVTNAFYAVNEKSISAKASGDTDYKPLVSLSTKKKKNTVEIKVTDNGNGIPDAVKEKIFQPFFTTKPTGQGTGLGLSMSYDIISKGHGGELKVESAESEGTNFIVQLPINA